ncbi:caspase family protein [Prosthecodimorpha staleyi]|uniref:Caspase family protein n=1 Tax=Prosthecodimorpha staleyi TaxID=2840188 RepID=A0A947D4H1_9HYPH|nr:caspase family protein [Prosthecodimorpha staleyi]MBT9287977.1 caspase family protein [Prosthecodimorpha staleyi]
MPNLVRSVLRLAVVASLISAGAGFASAGITNPSTTVAGVKRETFLVIHASLPGRAALDCLSPCNGSPLSEVFVRHFGRETRASAFADAFTTEVDTISGGRQRSWSMNAGSSSRAILPDGCKPVALVFANADYRFASRLRGPVLDERRVTQHLRSLDVPTTSIVDADGATLRAALSAFVSKLGSDSCAIVYLAGHGVDIDGRHYFAGTDIDTSGGKAPDEQAIDIDDLLRQVGDGAVVVLDMNFSKVKPSVR